MHTYRRTANGHPITKDSPTGGLTSGERSRNLQHEHQISKEKGKNLDVLIGYEFK